MKLTYRGVQYDYEPTVLETTDSNLYGRYRGQSVQFKYPRHVPAPTMVHDLKYRGVAYRNDGSTPARVAQPAIAPMHRVQPVPIAPVDQAIKTRSVEAVRRNLLADTYHAHQESIYRQLRHRIEVAKAQGNDVLLRQLEAEKHQLA